MNPRRDRARVRVSLATPLLALWESDIARVLGVAPATMLGDVLAAALDRAGITVDSPAGVAVFTPAFGPQRVSCGRHLATIGFAEADRVLVFEVPLDAHQTQFLALHAEERGRAALIQQSVACRSAGLPPRPPTPAGRTVVRFGSDELAARDATLVGVLGGGSGSVTAWVGELLASRQISVVGAPQPTWRGGLEGTAIHADRRVRMKRTGNPAVLDLRTRLGPRTEIALLLLARPHGGAELVTESLAYSLRRRSHDR